MSKFSWCYVAVKEGGASHESCPALYYWNGKYSKCDCPCHTDPNNAHANVNILASEVNDAPEVEISDVTVTVTNEQNTKPTRNRRAKIDNNNPKESENTDVEES